MITAGWAHLICEDPDWSWTWAFHGKDGHLPHRERVALRDEVVATIRAKCEEQKDSAYAKRNVQLVYDIYEVLRDDTAKVPLPLSLILVSGPSRAGGTFVLNHTARLRGIDVSRGNIYFHHDFDPHLCHDHAMGRNREEVLLWLALLIAHTAVTGQPAAKRTVLGTLLLPVLDQLGDRLDANVQWWHCLRDFPSCARSLDKMYEGYKDYAGHSIQASQFSAYTGAPANTFNDLMGLKAWEVGCWIPACSRKPKVLHYGAWPMQALGTEEDSFHGSEPAPCPDGIKEAYRDTLQSLAEAQTKYGVGTFYKDLMP